MKSLISITLAVVLAGALGIWVHDDPGYVLLRYHHSSVEMPLWLLAVLWLLSAWLFRSLMSVIQQLSSTPRRIKQWRDYRRQYKRHQAVVRALQAAWEGHWAQSIRALDGCDWRKGVSDEERLLAAQRALHDHDPALVFEELEGLSRGLNDDLSGRALCLRAQALMLQHREEEAKQLLQEGYLLWPNHPKVIHDWAKELYQSQDWLRLLPVLIRMSLMDDIGVPLDLWKKTTLEKICLSPDYSFDVAHLDDYFNQLPSAWRREPELLELYLRGLVRLNQSSRAAKIIQKHIPQQWVSSLACLYCDLTLPSEFKQLSVAQKWLEYAHHDLSFYNHLARLCLRERSWDLAKQYLNVSLSLKPQKETLLILAEWARLQSSPQEALHYHQQAAALMETTH